MCVKTKYCKEIVLNKYFLHALYFQKKNLKIKQAKNNQSLGVLGGFSWKLQELQQLFNAPVLVVSLL